MDEQIQPRTELHVFCYDGEEYFVAANLEDAKALLIEEGFAEDDEELAEIGRLKQLPDETRFAVYTEDGLDLFDDAFEAEAPIERTCREWADLCGRGHFAGSEY